MELKREPTCTPSKLWCKDASRTITSNSSGTWSKAQNSRINQAQREAQNKIWITILKPWRSKRNLHNRSRSNRWNRTLRKSRMIWMQMRTNSSIVFQILEVKTAFCQILSPGIPRASYMGRIVTILYCRMGKLYLKIPLISRIYNQIMVHQSIWIIVPMAWR